MKKLTILILFFACAIGYSQIEHFEADYIELIKKDIQAESRKIVEENLELTAEQANVFWPLYDEYDAAYDAVVDERLKIIEDYMLDYYALDDETTKDLINRSIELNQKTLDTKEEYINKMLDELPATVVGKFFQIDNRIDALIDVIRMSTIPLIRKDED